MSTRGKVKTRVKDALLMGAWGALALAETARDGLKIVFVVVEAIGDEVSAWLSKNSDPYKPKVRETTAARSSPAAAEGK